MKGGKSPLKLKAQPKGYTVVEVMIVLAVSGMMFLMAATFINGKQQKTAFTQGSNELGSKIQKVIDDVINGHYSDVPLKCEVGGANRANASIQMANVQGTNNQCVFLGKLVHFYKAGTTDPENYETLSVADKRLATDTSGVYTNNQTSLPRSSIGLINPLTVKSKIPQGLWIKKMEVTLVRPDGSYNNRDDIYNIGFVQGSGEIANVETGEYKSGAQTVQLAASNQMRNDSETVPAHFMANIRPTKSAKICVTDGKFYAQILIGNNDNATSQLNVQVKQLGEVVC